MKVYLHGKDQVGWSIDSDRRHAGRFLTEIGHTVTGNFIKADVVHSVWWNQLLARRCFLLRFKKKVIATATNEIKPEDKDYLSARKFVSLWVAPSKKQYDTLKTSGARVAYQPFYVDQKVFRRLDKSKEELASLLGMNYLLIKDKFLIGSFQRDTLGSDLKSPKWQKGPELLLEILSSLPDKDKWLLILCGPRRHFMINECEKRRIPYFYYGRKPTPGVDDITINTLDHQKMALLYNLVDCYLVTSKSEGGPKAVLEASFCKTVIFSTDVGLAPDILDSRCICSDSEIFVSKISRMLRARDEEYFSNLIIKNFNNINAICSHDMMKKRWKHIYESL